MGFFDDAWKAAENLGQEAVKRGGPAAADAWKNLDKLGQEVGKRAGPAAADAWKNLDKLGQEIGKHAVPVAIVAFKHAGTIAQEASQHANALAQKVGESDWKFVGEFGEDMAKRVGSTVDDFWETISSGDLVNEISQITFPKIEVTRDGISVDGLPGIFEKLMQWILQHPTEFFTLLACIAAGPIAIAITPEVLGLAGFTPLGVAAGSIAAVVQAGLDPIAAHSAFAILTSAGMGGYGFGVVQAIAVGAALTGTCAPAAVSFLRGMKEDCECEKEKIE